MKRLVICLLLLLPAPALAGTNIDGSKQTVPKAPKGVSATKAPAKFAFGSARAGSSQQARPFGGYAKGCLAGGIPLAETGPTWQAMRLSRNRNWGHPELVDFIEKLSRKAARQPGWNGLYIGDMSQPRGGPMLTGHRSHQIGLDVDIWMLPARDLKLSPEPARTDFIDLDPSFKRRVCQQQLDTCPSRDHQGGGKGPARGADLCLSRCQNADVQG